MTVDDYKYTSCIGRLMQTCFAHHCILIFVETKIEFFEALESIRKA
jgi:hypothetical protein